MSMANDLTQTKLKELFKYDATGTFVRDKYHGAFVNHGGI